MIEPIIVITNNPMCLEKFQLKFNVCYIEGSVMDVFEKVRDYIHLNHKLLTHPLVSSIKPNEIPYRTVIISKNKGNAMDIDSLEIIENSISTTNKFLKDFGIPTWSESVLMDFQAVDCDILDNVFN